MVRCPLVQQDLGFCGPNPLGRHQHLPAASGVPPNAAAMVERSQSPVLSAWPVVNDLLTLPVADEQSAPGLDADALLDA